MRKERFETVSVLDDALDLQRVPPEVMLFEFGQLRVAELLEQYAKQGRQLTKFHLREIPRRTWFQYVRSSVGDTERPSAAMLARCFLAGVERIDNLQQPNGQILPTVEVAHLPGDDIGDERFLERVPIAFIEEIGEVAWRHSRFPLSIDRCFRLQPSYLELLDEIRTRPVASSLSLPASSSDAASSLSASTPPPTEQTDPDKSAPETG